MAMPGKKKWKYSGTAPGPCRSPGPSQRSFFSGEKAMIVTPPIGFGRCVFSWTWRCLPGSTLIFVTYFWIAFFSTLKKCVFFSPPMFVGGWILLFSLVKSWFLVGLPGDLAKKIGKTMASKNIFRATIPTWDIKTSTTHCRHSRMPGKNSDSFWRYGRSNLVLELCR